MLLGACFSPRWSVCSECGSATSVFGTLIMMSLRKVDNRALTQNPENYNKLDSLEFFLFEISLWSTCHAFLSNIQQQASQSERYYISNDVFHCNTISCEQYWTRCLAQLPKNLLPSKFAYCLHREDLGPISLVRVDIRTYIYIFTQMLNVWCIYIYAQNLPPKLPKTN